MRSIRSTVAKVVPVVLLVTAITPITASVAAPSHFNTDPYTTGCSKTAWTLATRSVSGGTASIKVSNACGTNWIEYSGVKQTTTKQTMDHATNKWTRAEVDNTAWSYSMQSYAPGSTKLTATIKIGTTTTTATCSSGCTLATSTPSAPTASSKASKAVAWGNSMMGSTAYNGWCERFVENAYGTSGKYASALAAFNALKAAGTMKYTTTNIPAGSLVFSRNDWDGGYGHVMIARGDGTFINPASTVRVSNNPAGGTTNQYRFLGWSPAPAGWPGR